MRRIAGTVKPGVIASLTLLELWIKKELVLTESEYDELVDTVIEFLGDTRDERYRLKRD